MPPVLRTPHFKIAAGAEEQSSISRHKFTSGGNGHNIEKIIDIFGNLLSPSVGAGKVKVWRTFPEGFPPLFIVESQRFHVGTPFFGGNQVKGFALFQRRVGSDRQYGSGRHFRLVFPGQRFQHRFGALGILSANCRYSEIAIALFDFLASEEGTRVQGDGPQGFAWDYVTEGTSVT